MTDAEKATATVEAVRTVLGDGIDDNRDPSTVLSMLRTVVATYYPERDPKMVDLGGGMMMRIADDPAFRPTPSDLAVLSQLAATTSR